MPELLVLLAGLVLAGAYVLVPLRRPATPPDEPDAAESARVRHRVALEALRDAEADAAAGLLDPAVHQAIIGEAEARAADTRRDLDAALAGPEGASVVASSPRLRTWAVGAACVVGAVALVGSIVSLPGFAQATVVNDGLAAAQAAEAARQETITELLAAVAADPTDAEALSDLADAYLAGPSRDDLARAAAALQLLLNAEPGRPDAYERIVTAYLRAGDYPNARAALDSYAALDAADPVEVAFFDGLIALRGEADPDRALAAFETFLELAPDDPRAGMIAGLRDEAAAGD